MTQQQITNKIAELTQWLQDNPNHSDRALIEADLRKYKDQQVGRTIERDTFDLREINFYSV